MITKIDFVLCPTWPKLAWVAMLAPNRTEIKFFHGEMVEIRENWAVEAVWCGDFNDGDFDQTDLVFGTGMRVRESDVIFVSSATAVDRLWHTQVGEFFVVSNTLPGILYKANLSLLDSYTKYCPDIESVEHKGIYSYVQKIPTSGSDLTVTYYKNLLWRGATISAIDKKNCTPAFHDYTTYEEYLRTVAIALSENARSPSRSNPVQMLVGISSGYDSTATAVIARHAGCSKAASIVNPSSFWRGSDSGEHIAELLGMDCRKYRHVRRKYSNETACWAGAGNPGGRNMVLFEYPKPLCLYFSGMYGDTIWNRNRQGLKEPQGDIDALLCEFRLIEGVFVTSVPWWGIKRAAEIQKINLLEEMKPWTLGTDYDRPIARRLIEEAGIPRGEFAKRKKDTASNRPLRWPSTHEARESFEHYLTERGIAVPGPFKIRFFEILSRFLNLAYKNTVKHLGIRKWWRPWLSFPGRHLLFAWANHTLRDTYYREK